MSEESFVYTCCPGWGDHEYCVLKTIVKDGEIVRTEHADYTGPEANEGHICQKGIMACRQPYNPDRLTHPLKRVGERGAGQWEKISWDQAFDEIAAKIVELRDQYGPESLAMWNLVASVPPSQGLHSHLASRFMGLWGATDPCHAYGLDNGPLYAGDYDFGDLFKYLMTEPANFDTSKYLIVWGANPVENQQRLAKHIVEAKSRGAKIVDIGLLFDGTAGYADWFIPVKPGTDTALALCMVQQIIEKNLYKADFLLEHTVAPYLVRDDNDLFMRDGDGNYIVWDADTDSAVIQQPGVKELSIKNPVLSGEFELFGVKCKTAFRRLEEHAAPFTPEYQETITGVPAADAAKLAYEYASTEPAYIVGALGLRYQNQGESYRSFYLLGALTGNLGIPGGGVTSECLGGGWPIAFNTPAITMPNGPENYKGVAMRQAEFFDAVESGESNIKALWVTAGNPVHNCPNRSRWVERVFPNLELVVDVDIWLTDTGEYADYVLPDCMPFERYELANAAAYNHVVLQEPAIEPVGEAKDPTFLYSELAKRVGLGEYFDKTAEEWIEVLLDTQYPPVASVEPKITLERLKKEKVIRGAFPEMPWNPFWGMQFTTPSARMEFYSERLAPANAMMASHRDPMEAPTQAQLTEGGLKYPYQFFSGRQRFFMQSMFTDDPVMVQMSGGKPSARINPADAAKEGIKDGDRVEVFNQRGHVVADMRLDQAIPPGTIQVWFGWRHKSFEEGMYSELLIPLGGTETLDDTANLWWEQMSERGLISAGFGTGSKSAIAGAWDTIWDCACDIRKVEKGE